MSESPAIEALLFDLGGVVIDIDFDRALRSWEKHSRLSIDEIRGRSDPALRVRGGVEVRGRSVRRSPSTRSASAKT